MTIQTFRSNMKTCFKCHQTKPLDEYYRHSAMGDGHLNKCKECTKNDAEARRAIKTKDPVWVACELVRHRAKAAKYRAMGHVGPRNNKSNHIWRAKNPEKRSAHAQVSQALRAGVLRKTPCVVCGDVRVHGHHEDYTKPLDVIWLCSACHGRAHRRAA